MQVLNSPQNFDRPIFERLKLGIQKYRLEVIFNGIATLHNFIKVYRFVQKLIGGNDKQIVWLPHKRHCLEFPREKISPKIIDNLGTRSLKVSPGLY
jgi:hypothetical protein